jgi:hypothetical protein
MRLRIAGLILAVSSLAVASTAEAADCVGSGARAAWGQNMTATFEVASGGSCTYGFVFDGTASNSKILKRPQRGTARMINVSTMEYKSKAGFKGTDSFVIQATGRGITSSGTSNITMNAMVK